MIKIRPLYPHVTHATDVEAEGDEREVRIVRVPLYAEVWVLAGDNPSTAMVEATVETILDYLIEAIECDFNESAEERGVYPVIVHTQPLDEAELDE
jgi:hypothetical protein